MDLLGFLLFALTLSPSSWNYPFPPPTRAAPPFPSFLPLSIISSSEESGDELFGRFNIVCRSNSLNSASIVSVMISCGPSSTLQVLVPSVCLVVVMIVDVVTVDVDDVLVVEALGATADVVVETLGDAVVVLVETLGTVVHVVVETLDVTGVGVVVIGIGASLFFFWLSVVIFGTIGSFRSKIGFAGLPREAEPETWLELPLPDTIAAILGQFCLTCPSALQKKHLFLSPS